MSKEIYLYSQIYDFVAESIISQLEDNIGNDVVMRVASPGGNVKASYGLMAKVKEHGNVSIKVDGHADSMAANLLLFAKKAECLDVSTFVLHRAAFYDGYIPDEIEANMLTKINKEAPFPTPLSVINSPAHITNIDPAVSAIIVSKEKPIPGCKTAPVPCTQIEMPKLWSKAQPKATYLVY